MADTTRMMTDVAISVVPANEASWDDLRTVFGTRGDASRCQCQWFKIREFEWRSVSVDERAERLRDQTGCGHPGARATSGLVAYFDRELAGWCAVPRTAYVRLLRTRVPTGRAEDKIDDGVWV
jgi:hypothetical protein